MITKSRPSLFPSSRREVRFWKKLGQQSLAVKLIIAISAVVCLVVGIGTMILMHVSRRSIAETSVTTALYQTQLLKNKLVETMLTAEKRHEGLEFLLHSQGKTFGLNEVNIFNTDGKVTFSTIPNNLGKTVTIQPNKVDRATPDDALIKFTDTSKSGKLRIVHPIRGGSQCISCHTSATNGLFGGIELFVPLRPIYERFAVNNSFFIFLALALIVLIAFLIRWTVHRIVKRPLKKLMTVMERAERGELEVKTNIKEDPELRRLAKSFNTMVRGIRSAQRSIEIQHQRELAQSNRLASLGQYISNISHEIKNPLAAISSALHALKSEFETADGEEVFQELRIQLERIERTVNNLLRYARQAPPSFERCRVMNPIHAALESADHRFRESNIRVKIECDS
ncbi:MAG: HAMP domain-containing histidine kinase, partial [Candidatus Omnitrophica bacterium]|nr:HAMP domain-containing histidine kinase [Candidatus Omnitrophota bacterium]